MLKSPHFIKESIAELKQVVWPTKRQLMRLTLIVISVSIITGALISGLDYLFLKFIGLLIK